MTYFQCGWIDHSKKPSMYINILTNSFIPAELYDSPPQNILEKVVHSWESSIPFRRLELFIVLHKVVPFSVILCEIHWSYIPYLPHELLCESLLDSVISVDSVDIDIIK